ncbi:hypothetical protein SCP_1500280 [Sparassis crispa]|uniref:Uncharacterized protein n=1 Tax=Sparassis crispa TaxID=139825 RepID=A0A401H3K5_9APHY|nr:hypothetical protein SCP_1500280 [Sparassis crispa]GBE89026.1 hypothetical protein SCP_1500280 [Sparassis crispa]
MSSLWNESFSAYKNGPVECSPQARDDMASIELDWSGSGLPCSREFLLAGRGNEVSSAGVAGFIGHSDLNSHILDSVLPNMSNAEVIQANGASSHDDNLPAPSPSHAIVGRLYGRPAPYMPAGDTSRRGCPPATFSRIPATERSHFPMAKPPPSDHSPFSSNMRNTWNPQTRSMCVAPDPAAEPAPPHATVIQAQANYGLSPAAFTLGFWSTTSSPCP